MAVLPLWRISASTIFLSTQPIDGRPAVAAHNQLTGTAYEHIADLSRVSPEAKTDGTAAYSPSGDDASGNVIVYK